MSRVPGYPAASTRPGRSRASRSGRASSSPASRVGGPPGSGPGAAGVAGGVEEAGQVQGEQVGQGEQQPGQPGRVAAGELAGDVGVVLVGQGTGPGQVVAAGAAAGGARA